MSLGSAEKGVQPRLALDGLLAFEDTRSDFSAYVFSRQPDAALKGCFEAVQGISRDGGVLRVMDIDGGGQEEEIILDEKQVGEFNSWVGAMLARPEVTNWRSIVGRWPSAPDMP